MEKKSNTKPTLEDILALAKDWDDAKADIKAYAATFDAFKNKEKAASKSLHNALGLKHFF
ncbi:MAG TPA: hypothetical protein VG347_17695 [Verrucomicrobiae bacterium]|nr:hypothetical protein [Verrucomicrobiae bacterium]